jgi:transcriptional antiterminator NusG
MNDIKNQNSDQKHNWYILNVVSGQENKIEEMLRVQINNKKFDDNVSEVLLPLKNSAKIHKGKKTNSVQKIFPGYIFIKANLNSSAYNFINQIPKVIGFLGGKNRPDVVSEAKMQEVFSLIENQDKSVGSYFEVGEVLKVIDGPFESFSGVVEEFDVEKKKVKIAILIFGRSTSVELDIDKVEKS